MKIGIMSDSHDHLPNIKKALAIMIEQNVDKIFHCGDIVAPFVNRVLTPLKTSPIDLIGVFGNNDGERDNMNKLLAGMMEVKGDFFEIELDGIKIAIYHGTILPLVKALTYSQLYDLVLVGHTHQTKIERIRKTLLVNPGELCGYLTGDATFAVIDLSKQFNGELPIESVEIISLNNLR